MNATILRRRLNWLEIPLVLLALVIFYIVTDRKEIGYATGILAGLGFLTLAFFRPAYGLICAMVLLFTESTVNTINALVEIAIENDLSGVPSLLQSMWFAWGVLIIYAVLLLSYFAREALNGRKPIPMNGLEWILVTPLMAVLTYLPISMIRGHEFINYVMDILPQLIFASVVIVARVFYRHGHTREARYFYLDWFLIFNLLILIPLWGYNVFTEPWRNGLVGIAAIRGGTGPYDFNFFLVPILGMILTHDDNLPIKRRRFYQICFFLSLIRIVISMFRGAIGGVIIALFLATLMIEPARRKLWLKSLGKFILIALIIFGIAIATVPVVRTTFNVALVKRINMAINQGAGGGSLAFRDLEAKKAFRDIGQDPIIGYGPGSIVTKHFNARKFAKHELYLHSGYIWYWYKLGLLGIVVVIAFYLGIFGACIKLLRRKMYPADRGWVIGTFAAVLAMVPVVHYNNFLIRSQGVYALSLLLTGLVIIMNRYRHVPRFELPEAEGDERG